MWSAQHEVRGSAVIRSALNLVVVVAMFAHFCVAGRVAHARDRAWIEVIETYEIPFDPDWRESALKAASFREFGSSGAFGQQTGSVDRSAEFAERLEQAGGNDRSKKALIAAWRKEVESYQSTANAARELFVVRAWDGIRRKPITLVLGEKQRGAFARCKPAAVLNVEIGTSNVPDHLQARGRATIASVVGGAKVPTDFLYLVDEMPDLRDFSFGEIDLPSLQIGNELGGAQKDPAAGSGIIAVTFDLPASIPIESGMPWYCEYKLMELDNNGSPAKEVRFEGSKHAVAISGSRAKARIEIKNPKPYGYVAEATAWFGVAPNAVLMPAKQGAAPSAPASKAPSKPAAPAEAPSTPEIPEPETPPITIPD
jgi:hypothetical protein